MAGFLEKRYVQVHPDATTGRVLSRWFDEHPDRWFTHSELKAALGCSDRIIREHVPEALNRGSTLIEIDKSGKAWRYRYSPR